QRLVQVELRQGDVVLEPALDRGPAGVQGAQHGVAVAHRVHQDPHAHQVVDGGEVVAAHEQLLVDRVVVLGPTGHRGIEASLAEGLVGLGRDGGEVLLPGGRVLRDEGDDLLVHLRIEHLEGAVLELPLHGVQPEPMRQRRVDLEGLLRLPLGGGGRDVLPGARVVQPVGQLDQQHPHVAAHRDDQLADGLRLRGLAVGDLVELRDAVDHHGDHLAELGAQPLERRSEEHTSELQSRFDLVCRHLLEKKKFKIYGENYYSVVNPDNIEFIEYIIILNIEKDYLANCYKSKHDDLVIVIEYIY